MRTILRVAAALTVLMPAPMFAGPHTSFGLHVLVADVPAAEYVHEGTRYVEALRGEDYTLRLTNPMPWRVAVALSVDGLNTIDARHTDAWAARKWVIGPYESIEIPGWQVSGRAARRFTFTGERQSYGAALGETANLGVIEAVFFREREVFVGEAWQPREERKAAPAPQRMEAAGKSSADSAPSLSDDYAATGMGDRTQHRVRAVEIDLERKPVASVRIRYEFRPQLVRLGVLPARESALERRERARGFEGFCPEPRSAFTPR